MADSVVQCITVEDVARTTRTAGFYPIDVDPSGPRPRFTVALLTVAPQGRRWFLVGMADPWTDEMIAGRRIGPRIVLPGEAE